MLTNYLTILKNNKSQKGFTLIELLVVVAILAILAVIGATVYNNVQINARDARRKSDIDAIASAFEANKVQNSPTYTGLAASQFQQQSIPTDTTTAKYCISTSLPVGTIANPTIASAWAATVACPTAPGVSASQTAYGVIGDASGNGSGAWTICARLESGGTFYCKSATQ